MRWCRDEEGGERGAVGRGEAEGSSLFFRSLFFLGVGELAGSFSFSFSFSFFVFFLRFSDLETFLNILISFFVSFASVSFSTDFSPSNLEDLFASFFASFPSSFQLILSCGIFFSSSSLEDPSSSSTRLDITANPTKKIALNLAIGL